MDSKKRFRNSVLVTILLLLFLSISLPMAHSASKLFPFEDVNNNGIYDPGIDNDISAAIKKYGWFETTESIVFPKAGGGIIGYANGISLLAGKDITLSNYYLTAGAAGSSIYIDAGGRVTVDTALRGYAGINISGGGDVVVTSNSNLSSPMGMVYVESSGGDVTVNGGARLSGRDNVYLAGVNVTVEPKATINSLQFATVFSEGDVNITGAEIKGFGLYISTSGHLIEFCDNVVTVAKKAGWVYLSSEGSTVDISGTKFQGLDPANLIIEADEIIK
jgi:hypothetical protein